MKPILFSTEMVMAILDGRKTVTRRVIKDKDIINGFDLEVDGKPIVYIDRATGDRYKPEEIAPYKVGDILYVRETWNKACDLSCHTRNEKADCKKCNVNEVFVYKADHEFMDDKICGGWKPSLHMPKEAARIFLRVTDMRVERLQDITWQQAAQEGCQGSTGDSEDELFHIPTLKGEFYKLWDSTIKKADVDKYGWNANPWVWVVEFEKIEKPEDGTDDR